MKNYQKLVRKNFYIMVFVHYYEVLSIHNYTIQIIRKIFQYSQIILRPANFGHIEIYKNLDWQY